MSPSACVLAIDHNETIRELVTAVFADEGYDAIAVPDTASALAVLRRQRPHLILLDSLPLGGRQDDFVRQYRRLPGPHAPIYLFTTARDADAQARRLGDDGVLSKPFDIEVLLTLAQHHDCPARR